MSQPWFQSDRCFVATTAVTSSSDSEHRASTSGTNKDLLQRFQCLVKGQVTGFSCRGDVPVYTGFRPGCKHSGCAASLTSDSFISRPGHLHLVSDLNANSLIDLGSEALQSTHRQMIHNIERVSVSAMHWIASWRLWHPLQHESSKQLNSDSGLYRSKGHLRASREVQRLSEQAELAEKQVRIGDLASRTAC